MTDDHVCRPVVDESGVVLGHARVSPGLGPAGEAALLALVRACIGLQEARDAADPEGAVERGRRQEAARVRNRERLARIRGEQA